MNLLTGASLLALAKSIDYFLSAFLFQIKVGNTGIIQKVYKSIKTV